MNKQKLFGTLAASLMLLGLAGSLSAATSQTTTIWDDPSDSTPTGGGAYEIKKMDVTWDSDDNLTVDVYTNFAGKAGNSSYAAGGWYIRYGDLLISTPGSSNWNYAFMLDQNDSSGPARKSNPTSANPADGYLVNFNSSGGKVKAKDWHTSGAGEPNEVVTTAYDAGTNPVLSTGSWQVDPHSSSSQGIISFSFNVGALGLTNPTQLAFRWAMTCANDIVSGVAYSPPGGGDNQVPEPAILTLIFAGIAGFGFSRRRKETSS